MSKPKKENLPPSRQDRKIIWVDSKVHRKAKILAAMKDKSIKDMLDELLEAELKK